MIRLDYRSARPLYEQIYEGLRRLILTGAMAENEKLPSVRTLAQELSINPNTIQRAYNALEGDGYIYSVTGKGSFVAPSDEAGVRARADAAQKVRTALAELRALGVSAEEATALIKEVYSQ